MSVTSNEARIVKRFSVRKQQPKLSRNPALADRIRTAGKRHGRSPGEVAIAWTLRHPAVTAAIVGARSAAQAGRRDAWGRVRLSNDEIAVIEVTTIHEG